MVEFGLKLEDNKVSEWNEHYVDYDKLKAILKHAKSAQKKYDELAKKRPDDATKIVEAYQQGDTKFVTLSPSTSKASLQQLLVDAESKADATERTSLLARSIDSNMHWLDGDAGPGSEYVTVGSHTFQSPNRKAEVGGLTLEQRQQQQQQLEEQQQAEDQRSSYRSTFTGISEYFGSRYERSMREHLKLVDQNAQEFGVVLLEEVDKVSKFYYSKLEELETQLKVLIENVAESYNIHVVEEYDVDERDNNLYVAHGGGGGGGGGGSGSGGTATTTTPTPTTFHRMPPPTNANARRNQPHRLSLTDQGQHLIQLVSTFTKNKKEQWEIENLKMTEEGASDEEEDQDDPRSSKAAAAAAATSSSLNKNTKDEDVTSPPSAMKKKLGETDSIKRALIDQYRTAKLLHNFAIMNYTGFVKIVKKHDKTIPEAKGRYKHTMEPSNLFDEGQAVEELANRLEKFYAVWFCDGDIRAAHAQMLPKRGDGLEMDWTQLRLGYRMGMCAVLGMWVCWDCIWGLVKDGKSTIGGRAAFPVFRACGGILMLQWFWGCSVFMWTRYRINYIYLFDFDPRIVATPLGIFQNAVDNSLVFMVLTLLYYKSGAHDIPQWIPAGGYPFLLVVFTVMKLIFPLRTRMPMWAAVAKVVTAPLHSPNFFHGYVGDIFTSMVKVFQDIAWTACWVGSGEFMISEDLKKSTKHAWSKTLWYKNILIPIICLLPLVIRFNQCLRRYFDTGDRFPHLANALKYAMSQTVTLFGAFHPLYLLEHRHLVGEFNLFQIFWLILFVSSSLYSFSWDVYMDWGLGRRKYGFLGQSLMYPRRFYYYCVMALDLVLRFMWVLTLLPPQSGAKFEIPAYLSALTMMLELFRRTIWGFLRLENEHRSNAAGFRRVGFVPLHFNTGHQHRYKAEKQHRGLSVLTEVAVIAIAVVGVCIFSVVAAQRATRETTSTPNSEL